MRNSGTSIVRPSRHPACAGRGRRMTTAINMFAMGFGVVTPRPGLSLRYLATERSPCVKLTDDNDNWSSRRSLVVKKGRSATTRLCGSEERFITLSQFGSIENVASEAPFKHCPIVGEATLVRRNHSAASASREAFLCSLKRMIGATLRAPNAITKNALSRLNSYDAITAALAELRNSLGFDNWPGLIALQARPSN
jgi:hypothetical protein